nr:hypothetical protein [Tanacetum cinerariifolium]
MMVQAREDMGEGSAKPTDPHPTPTITQPSTSKPQKKQKPRNPRRQDPKETQPSGPTTNVTDEALNEENAPAQLKLNELMELHTKLSERVLNMETTKTTQAKEISSLKRRVKRLEKKRRSRTHGLKRLYKVGLSTRVESSAEEQSLGKEDASKQGRNIADIDPDDEITLDETVEDQGRFDDQDMFDTSVLDDEEVVEKEILLKEAQDVQNIVKKVIEDITTTIKETVSTAASITTTGIKETVSTAASITTTDVTPDELTMAQALVEIKKSKPKGDKVVIKQEPEQGTTTTTTTVTIRTPDSTRPKARGVVMQEPKPLKMKKKDQINFDEQKARRFQTEFDEQDRLREEKAQQIKDEDLAWDNVQDMIDADYELATRLQEKEQGELTVEEKSRLFVELMDKRKKHFAKLRVKEKRRKPLTKAQKRNQIMFILPDTHLSRYGKERRSRKDASDGKGRYDGKNSTDKLCPRSDFANT